MDWLVANGGRLLLWRKLVLSLLLFPLVSVLHGQDIAGQWQGTVQTATPFRVALKILKSDDQMQTFIIFVDHSPDYFPVSTVSGPNGEAKFSIAMYASIDGKMSSDGNQITGTWTSGVESAKLDLHRATPEESWLTKSTIHMITVAPNVSLEVVDWGGNGPPLVFLSGLARSRCGQERILARGKPLRMQRGGCV